MDYNLNELPVDEVVSQVVGQFRCFHYLLLQDFFSLQQELVLQFS